MAAIEQIAELNNWATVCLDINRMGEALRSLQSALQLSKSQLRLSRGVRPPPLSSSSSSSEQDHRSSYCSYSPPHPSRMVVKPMIRVVPPPQQQQLLHHRTEQEARTTMMADIDHSPSSFIDDDVHDDIMMMDIGDEDDKSDRPFNTSAAIQYHEPIEIDPDSFYAGGVEDDWATHNGLTSILIFNLALVYDLAAKEAPHSPREQAALENKAKSLYEKVLQLHVLASIKVEEQDRRQQEEHHSGGSSSSRSSSSVTSNTTTARRTTTTQRPGMLGAIQDIIAMAAVNNLIHLERDDETKQDLYVQMLMEIAKAVDRADYGDGGELKRLVDWQTGIFLLNAFFLKRPWSIPGAAAAAA